MKYRIILADPPWSYSDLGQSGSKRNSGAAANYSVMGIDQIRALPVGEIADADSLLFLWATGPQLPDALSVMAAWGFAFKTVAFTWIKTGRIEPARQRLRARLVATQRVTPMLAAEIVAGTEPDLLPAFPIGQGSYTRANPEFVLLGRRGAGVPRLDAGVRAQVLAPRGRHSEKPSEIHAAIERLVGDVSRLELFARTRRPGWASWGNEIESDAIDFPCRGQHDEPEGDKNGDET